MIRVILVLALLLPACSAAALTTSDCAMRTAVGLGIPRTPANLTMLTEGACLPSASR